MKTKSFLKNKVTVGSFPYMNNQFFDAKIYDTVINVSDEFYFDIDFKLRFADCETFWFPMNEAKKDIGINSIYGAMVVLYNCEMNNRKVYLHCHQGINRSQMVFDAYYFMRTGEQRQTNNNGFINKLVASCTRGYLPPKTEMEKFLTLLNKQILNFKGEPMGGLLDEVKCETINNF